MVNVSQLRRDQRTYNIEIEILVDIRIVPVGGVTAIVACVSFGQVVDDEPLWLHDAALVVQRLGDGHAVVGPVLLCGRLTRGLAVKLGRLSLCFAGRLRLHLEVWGGWWEEGQ